MAGEIVDGVPVVAMGGRGLSHASGLMNETTVFTVLRTLREMPGSPLLLIARGAGHLADRYALTTPTAPAPAPTDMQLAAARVEPVHPAWSVIGLRCRRIYDEITRRENRTSPPEHRGEEDGTLRAPGCATADIFAAAQVGLSSGYNILTELLIAGLVVRAGRGTIATGVRRLDDVAAAAGVARVRRERIVRHRAERIVWRAWLEHRFAPPPPDIARPEHDPGWATAADSAVFGDKELYWSSLMATGPPDDDVPDTGVEATAIALALLGDILGARVLA